MRQSEVPEVLPGGVWEFLEPDLDPARESPFWIVRNMGLMVSCTQEIVVGISSSSHFIFRGVDLIGLSLERALEVLGHPDAAPADSEENECTFVETSAGVELMSRDGVISLAEIGDPELISED